MRELLELRYAEGESLGFALCAADGHMTPLRAGDVLQIRADHTRWTGRLGLFGGVLCLLGRDGQVTPLASLCQLARRHILRATLLERGEAPAPVAAPLVCVGKLKIQSAESRTGASAPAPEIGVGELFRA